VRLRRAVWSGARRRTTHTALRFSATCFGGARTARALRFRSGRISRSTLSRTACFPLMHGRGPL
jgi:hypothetical protein